MSAISNLVPEEVSQAGLCDDVYQLCAPAARRLANRALRPILDQSSWIAVEALGSADKAIVVARAGGELQRALQILAGAQAKSLNAELHKRLRLLQGFGDQLPAKIDEVEKGIESQLAKIEKDPTPGRLSTAWSEAKKASPAEGQLMALCCLMAAYLGSCKDLRARGLALLELLETESDTELLEQLDEMLAEILDSPVGLRDLLGKSTNLGKRLTETLYLIDQKSGVDAKERMDLGADGNRLAVLMTRQHMPYTRASLQVNFMRGILSGISLTSSGDLNELLALLDMNDLINRDGLPLGGEAIAKEMRSRITRQVNPEALEKFLSGTEGDFPSRLKNLVILRDRVVGENNLRLINDFIRKLFDRQEFDTIVSPKESGVTKRLRDISYTYRVVKETTFPDGVQERLLEQTESLQTVFLHRQQIMQRIEKRSDNPVKIVMQYADMLLGGLITPGRNTELFIKAIRVQLAREDFSTHLFKGAASPDDKKSRLDSLRTRLDRLGLANQLQSSLD